MNKLLSLYHTHKKNCYLGLGLILSCLFMVPFLLLGTGSIITYHDQLDGELFSYLLTARYLFTDIRIYPEIMNGLPAAGAVPPAPMFVLLYVICSPFTAFMISQWIIYMTAFLGMYMLLIKLTGKEFISFSIAVVFMLLPFYPVYGLCIPGQPLLIYAVHSLFSSEISLKDTDKSSHSPSFGNIPRIFCRSSFPCYLIIVFYAASSSLVLVGFACLFILGIFALFETYRALHAKRQISLSPWLSFASLLLTYIITNFGLIRQVLFPETTYISHKSEMVLSAQNFFDYFREAFTTGISYAQSYHSVVFFLLILCLILFCMQCILCGTRPADSSVYHKTLQEQPPGKKESFYLQSSRRTLLKALRILLFIFIICLFYAFYHGSYITELRNASGGILKTFNLDRICWLLPTAWCILAGYLFSFLADVWKTGTKPVSFAKHSVPVNYRKAILMHVIIFAVSGIWGITILLHSPLRPNLSKLLKGSDYYALDWDNFFAEDIFSQINMAIGEPQENYRVISVGIYPAAAAYNGFYCLDGYSNNYPLEYKHTFREIMEGELNKSDYVRDFFDNWGNRCYITTAEQANYYTFEKKWNSVVYDLDLNIDKLKELNCKYIFSAAYLMNAEEKGLSLLQEAPFETEDSWYHIYVYTVY